MRLMTRWAKEENIDDWCQLVIKYTEEEILNWLLKPQSQVFGDYVLLVNLFTIEWILTVEQLKMKMKLSF